MTLIDKQLALAQGDEPAVTHLCAAVSLPRATYYRRRQAGSTPAVAEVEVRDALQRVALAWPTYGYRRLTAELRRRGLVVNHKRVLRLMRADNLLCLRYQRGFVLTTDSRHGLPVYPNLARGLTLRGLNQLWIADITYVRLRHEFIYLAVILDAYSRRVIGWALSARIDAALTLTALQMALMARAPLPAGLIHHSDRGVQYAATEYTRLLQQHGLRISMSRTGNPYDNAQCERFMKTLKYEEVYLTEYADLADARRRIGHFLEDIYNRRRLHSALGYVPPTEFEQALKATTVR